MKRTTNSRSDVQRFFLRSNFRRGALRAISLGVLLVAVATSASSYASREAFFPPWKSAIFVLAREPACVSTAVEAGNPATGPSAVLVKMEKGCMDSWHFHTAAEELIVIKGELK